MQQLLEIGVPIMAKLQDVFPLLEYTGVLNIMSVLFLTICMLF